MKTLNADSTSKLATKPAVKGESGLAPAPPAVTTVSDESAGAVEKGQPGGLTGDEARRRLERMGPNTVADTAVHPLRGALAKLWAPVPWMLEAAILLEMVLGKYFEAAIIAGLLVFNAALGLFQEGRAQATLAALKSRLALNASVRRDGVWRTVAAADLVPGDIVKLSLGVVVAADVRLVDGSVLLDQSMLTGESMPVEAGPGVQTYAGALVRRGEAVAEVTATGSRTKFGRTAELVRTAHVVSSQQKAVLRRGAQSRPVQRRSHCRAGGLCVRHLDAACRGHPARAHGGSRIDPGCAASHLYSCGGGWRTGPGQAGGLADTARCGGRSGNDGCPVRGQDGHADEQRTEGDHRLRHVRLRRRPRHGDGGAGELGRRAGSRRWRHSLRRLARRCVRSADTDQVRAVRSRHEDVRGDREGFGWRHAARREGGLCHRHGSYAADRPTRPRRRTNSRHGVSGFWRSRQVLRPR